MSNPMGMDISHRVAARASVCILASPAFISATKYISWAVTLNPYVQLVFQQMDMNFDIPGVIHDGMETADQVLGSDAFEQEVELLEQAEEPFTSIEAPAGPHQSVELGGPGVDADITEIIKLQAEHEKEWAEQKDAMDQVRENLNRNYEGPELAEHLQEFEKVAAEENDRLAGEHTAQLLQLQEQQLQRPPIEDPNRER